MSQQTDAVCPHSGHRPAIKRKEILTQAAGWRSLGGVVPSERSQTEGAVASWDRQVRRDGSRMVAGGGVGGVGCRAPVCDDGDLGMSAPVAQGCGHLPAAGLHAPREVSGKTSPTISGLPRHPEWVSGRSHVASARVEPLAGPGPWDRCPPLRPAEATGSAASLHQSSGVLLGRAFPAAAGGIWWPRASDSRLCGGLCG